MASTFKDPAGRLDRRDALHGHAGARQDEEVLRSADFNYMPNESLRDTFFNNADPIDLVSDDDDD